MSFENAGLRNLPNSNEPAPSSSSRKRGAYRGAQKIEAELTYPGVIKVNVIRERRIEQLAK